MNNELIGQILVDRGVMRVEHVSAVLEKQRSDPRPFGRLAETMYGISVEEIAAALAVQMRHATSWVNLAHQSLDPRVLMLLSPAESWDNLVLPLRREDRQLVCATGAETLPEALTVLQRRIHEPFRLVFAEMHQLEQFIAERYDYEGFDVAEEAA
ncbi:MAG: hypothetical protein ACOC1G_02695 [Phycisphaeraceae bacterium]